MGGALFAAGCGHAPAPQVREANKPVSPEVQPIKASVLNVQELDWPFIVRAQGSLTADEISQIGANIGGRVAEVHVDLGDVVDAGEPLVTLDQTDFLLEVAQAEAELLQARAALGLKPGEPVESLNVDNAPPVRQEKALWDEAKARLERVTRLQSREATTEEAVDTSIAQEQAAHARYLAARNSVGEKIALVSVRESALAIARQRLEDSVIKAPFAGLVQARHVAPGSYVQVGSQIVTLVRSDPLRFRGSMPERHAQKLSIGQQVLLHVESISEPVPVTINRISPALDERSRSLVFEATVANSEGRFRTGLFAEAEVVIDPDARALVVPTSAVVEFAGLERVWKVVNGKATEQIVLSGQRRSGKVEILSGLNVGDVILMEGKSGRVAPVVVVSDGSPSMTHTGS